MTKSQSAKEWDQIAQKRKSGDTLLHSTLYKGLLEYLISNAQKSTVLDFGCGCGDFCFQLAQKQFQPIGYDPSSKSVAVAQSNYGLPFFDTLPSSQVFDTIISNLVLCTLTDSEQHMALKQMKERAHKNTLYALTVCHPCFDIEEHSVVSRRHVPNNCQYHKTFAYQKTLNQDAITMHDYHRPLAHYFKLFNKHNLKVKHIIESDTLDTNHKPDFLTFILEDNQ